MSFEFEFSCKVLCRLNTICIDLHSMANLKAMHLKMKIISCSIKSCYEFTVVCLVVRVVKKTVNLTITTWYI